jgi:delta-1-pyrroline-5-carboxylate synthetase
MDQSDLRMSKEFNSNLIVDQCNVAGINPQQAAQNARLASRLLQSAESSVRSAILANYSLLLRENEAAIIAANELDMNLAHQDTSLSSATKSRLKLDAKKLAVLVAGLDQLANTADPINSLISRREITSQLELQQVTVAIGVLLIIFESRPDVLPQLVGLAIRTGIILNTTALSLLRIELCS